MRSRRVETLPVEAEGATAADGARAGGRRAATPMPAPPGGPHDGRGGWPRAARRAPAAASCAAIRRDATELTAACVLTLAILAALTAWGVLDIGGASSEPAPITTNAASD